MATENTPPENGFIPVSPLHRIEIAEGLRHLIDSPQEKDFPLATIATKRGPDGRELVSSHLVIAGRRTREAFPLARKYPVHFLKTYSPWTFHGDPKIEYDLTLKASEILGSPPPIGCDRNSFRSSFLPGKPLSRLSPFTDVQPDSRCLGIAEEAPPATLIGLWHLAEQVYDQINRLHQHGFFHRDLELHNIIVCTAPVRAFLIDFESAIQDFDGSEEEREDLRFRDLAELYRLAVFIQSGLGRQETPLGTEAEAAIPRLFKDPATFAARLDDADRRAAGG